MPIVAATPTDFDDFLVLYGYTVPDDDKSRLLSLSLLFIGTLDICEEGSTVLAQCFIAYAMSSEGGGFNPVSIADDKVLIEKGLGRGAIVKKWAANSSLSGTDALSMLKRLPMAYSLIKPLLCKASIAEAGSIGNFEVYR